MTETKWKYLWTNASRLGPKINGLPIDKLKWNPTSDVACVEDAVDRDQCFYGVYSFEIEGRSFRIATGERSPGINPIYVPDDQIQFYDISDERMVK